MSAGEFSPQVPAIGAAIDRPFTAALNAVLLFVLGLHIQEAAESGRISPKSFVEELRVETGGTGLTIRKAYTREQVVIGAEQARLAALAISAQAIDRALDETFGAKDPVSNTELNCARSIMYQIRNCFAHNPFNPAWRVEKASYLRVLKVPSIELVWNGGELAGKPLSPSHLGGYEGYVRLMQFCCSRIAAADAKTDEPKELPH